jgi:L-histidine N-alpha-methyltransferase
VAASRELLDRYKGLRVLGIVADFTRQMDVISEERPKIIVFLGSTMGNFDDEESHGLLRSIAGRMKHGDRCIVGLDMVKEKGIIEKAYNDAGGVTSEFNKNVLSVINRELGANFDPSGFDHLAFFNEERECVEMHLRANRKVRAEIMDVGLVVEFAEGETIHTERCRKFRRESAERMFARAGLAVTNWYADPRGWFSLVESAPGGNGAPRP